MIYAVNKRTKEHKLTNLSEYNMNMYPHSQYKIVEADADGWIEWSGGEQPVPDSSQVLVKYALSNGPSRPINRPQNYSWSHSKHLNSRIVAYKPILKPQAEQVKECPADYEAHKRNSATLLRLTKFLVKHGIGNVGDESVDIAIREISEKHGIGSAKSKMKEWRGPEDGLPPIGVEVDARMKSPLTGRMSDWKPVTLAFVHKGGVAMICQDELRMGHLKDVEFRPLKTDRERWIEAAMPVGVKEAELTSPDRVDGCQLESALGAIYDAGLAKLPEQTK